MSMVSQQRGPASSSCPGLHSRQLHVHAALAKGGRALVADHAQAEADQDRREGRQPRPPCHVTDGRGCRVAVDVPGDVVAHRPAAHATGADLTRSVSAGKRALGGVRIDDGNHNHS